MAQTLLSVLLMPGRVAKRRSAAAEPATTSRIRIGTGTTFAPSDPIVAAIAYATTGTYHCTLTLTAAAGGTCSSSGNITITAPTVPPKRKAVHH